MHDLTSLRSELADLEKREQQAIGVLHQLRGAIGFCKGLIDKAENAAQSEAAKLNAEAVKAAIGAANGEDAPNSL